MPLPAALLARLQKRGIVTEVEESKDEIEEVFAEDYDDQSQKEQPDTAVQHPEQTLLTHESIDCPNKSNPAHECSDYCKKKYGLKLFKVVEAMESRRLRMLRKYPLPVGWHEVADPETGRFYYWNEETDKVSWLSPTHPKSRITMSAEKLQALMKGKENKEAPPAPKRTKFSDVIRDDERRDTKKGEDDRRDKKRGRRDRKKEKDDALDPMDPASYSDIARGNWSSGLERGTDAKTGVDVTASGPLFQQRPYPSPGAVLRANKPPEKD